MDDWQRFVNESDPYGVTPGPTQVADIEDLLHISMAYLVVSLDWLDPALANAQVLLGGKEVWFDYLEALRVGLTGAQVENNLNDKGITVRAKLMVPVEEGLAAVVVVDADKEEQARKLFAKWGILL